MDKKAQIKNLIANNKIAEAIQMLREELGDDAIISLENQWKKLRKDELLGLLSYSETTTRRNQIVNALLELANEVGKPLDKTANPEETPISEGEKVFISYNHKDREAADKVVAFLEERGFAVTIDHEDLLGGRDIEDWITECLRTHKFIVSLVSENSLKSGWVGMESIMALFAEKLKEQSTRFIAVSLQDDIFDDDLLDEVYDFLEKELENSKARISLYHEKKRSTVDLNRDLERKEAHHFNLATIRDRLKRCKTIHAAGADFEKGLNELTKSLK